MASRPWKTKLEGPGGIVEFDVSVSIPEGRTASYDPYSLVHMPVDLYAYRNTSSRTFGIRAKLVSRNASEADRNIRNLDLVRSWVLPKFGDDGAPPPILKLTAYSNKNISKQTCVMKSYSWEFPEDVDYIFDGSQSPMPIIGNLSIDLVEIYSANEILAIDPWKITLNGTAGSFADDIAETSRSNVFNFAAGGGPSEGTGSGGGNLSSTKSSTPSISSPTSGVSTSTQSSSQPNGFGRTATTTSSSGGLGDV